MSFIERHKTWILPLLGLGAAAVVWFNFRMMNQPAPAQEPLQAAPAEPEPPPPMADAALSGSESLWDDLRPVAFVPPELESAARFDQLALASLAPEAFEALKTPAVPRPAGPEPARPLPKPRIAGESHAAPAPQPDFLILGPAGAQAWFEGRGYRPGQPLQGHPYTVQGIQILPAPKVTLEGPAGRSIRSTRSAPVQEVP